LRLLIFGGGIGRAFIWPDGPKTKLPKISARSPEPLFPVSIRHTRSLHQPIEMLRETFRLSGETPCVGRRNIRLRWHSSNEPLSSAGLTEISRNPRAVFSPRLMTIDRRMVKCQMDEQQRETQIDHLVTSLLRASRRPRNYKLLGIQAADRINPTSTGFEAAAIKQEDEKLPGASSSERSTTYRALGP